MLCRTPELSEALDVLAVVLARHPAGDPRASLAGALTTLVDGSTRAWESTLAGLRHAAWDRWPRDEQIVVRRVLEAVWEAQLATYDAHAAATDAAGRLLCGLACAYDDVGPFLDHWVAGSRLCPMRWLAAFVRFHGAAIAGRGELGGRWPERPDAMRTVVAWLGTPVVSDALELVAFTVLDGDIAAELDDAIARLRPISTTG